MQRKARKRLSCVVCKNSKLRCDRGHPCGTCRRRGCETRCSYSSEASLVQIGGHTPLAEGSEMSRHRSHRHSCPTSERQSEQTPRLPDDNVHALPELNSSHITSGVTAISDSPIYSIWNECLRRPTAEGVAQGANLGSLDNASATVGNGSSSKADLLWYMPSVDCCDYLISEYFSKVAPLFEILHGETFQSQYSGHTNKRLQSMPTLSWMALLFAMFSLSVNTLQSSDVALAPLWSQLPEMVEKTTFVLAKHMRQLALQCLAQSQFFFNHDTTTVEALLLLIYAVCHNEGVERGWPLLGLTLNIAISLRCNLPPSHLPLSDQERRKRCWAGVLMLHTYQGMLYRDLDMSFLIKIETTLPVDAAGVRPDDGQRESGKTSVLTFKMRLFELSTRIVSHIRGPKFADQSVLLMLDEQIAAEQRGWDRMFLVDGQPSVLDTTGYAHWCVLQTYAHELYLLIHRPFHHSQSPRFRQASRARCLSSSKALLNLHQQICELPRLRCYRWLAGGMTSTNALHGGVALVSCLLDRACAIDHAEYQSSFDAAEKRIDNLRSSSPVCARIHPVMRSLQ